jgi:ribosomal protein L19
VGGVVAVGDTVVRLVDLAEAGSITEPRSMADAFAGVVVASRVHSEDSLEAGIVKMRNGSGVNIIGSTESSPVLLDSITVCENQSSKLAQLGHTSSRSRWSSREYFR